MVGGQRAALRQEHFARPLARLHRLVSALQARVLPKTGLGQACAYLLGHWAPLTAHLRHSHTRLDTNAVENAIRQSKLGAKYGKVAVMERRPTGPWNVSWEVASLGRMWLVKYARLFREPMPLTRLWPKIPPVFRVSLPGSSLTFP
jgi:hypothetical protein